MSKEWSEAIDQIVEDLFNDKIELQEFVKNSLEQDKRTQELEKVEYAFQEIYRQEREYNKKLEQQNKSYREALEFYSKESNYNGYLTAGGWVKTPINDDNGEKARKILEGLDEQYNHIYRWWS